MFKYIFILLPFIWAVFGVSVIDNGIRFDEFAKKDTINEITGNDNNKDDEECSNLTAELIKEIKSHQSIVDKIVSSVVNGPYSGDTWDA